MIFALGLALLFTHELDAVRAREWRLFPVLRAMPEETGRAVFIAAHVPLFAIIFWMAGHASNPARFWFEAGVDAFLTVHVGLHWMFRRHPLYDFHGVLSRLWIVGAGAVGLLHLALLAAFSA